MIVLCVLVLIYFIFNVTSIVNVFMLGIEKKYILTRSPPREATRI